MNRRNFMKFLGLTPAAALSVAPVTVEAAHGEMTAEMQRLKDLAEFHQAAREAEAKTMDMLLGLKNGAPVRKAMGTGLTADDWVKMEGAVVLPLVQERKDA